MTAPRAAKRRKGLFYHYSQNNSFGKFETDHKRGISHHVVIEAESPEAADMRAESIGLYFDGCDIGRDCSCCGDRWSRAWGKGDVEPMIYNEKADSYVPSTKWIKDGPEGYVHFASGVMRGVPRLRKSGRTRQGRRK